MGRLLSFPSNNRIVESKSVAIQCHVSLISEPITPNVAACSIIAPINDLCADIYNNEPIISKYKFYQGSVHAKKTIIRRCIV